VSPPAGLAVAAASGGAPRPQAAAMAVSVRASIARATLAGAGLAVAVTVPAGTQALRVRIVTVASGPRARVLYTATRAVRAAGRTQTVRFRLRSRRLFAKVRPGRRYAVEVAAGRSPNTLGASSRTVFRVR
jgi:hypothetical protein